MNYAWIKIYLIDSVILLSNIRALAMVHLNGLHRDIISLTMKLLFALKTEKMLKRKFEGLYSIFKIHII